MIQKLIDQKIDIQFSFSALNILYQFLQTKKSHSIITRIPPKTLKVNPNQLLESCPILRQFGPNLKQQLCNSGLAISSDHGNWLIDCQSYDFTLSRNEVKQNWYQSKLTNFVKQRSPLQQLCFALSNSNLACWDPTGMKITLKTDLGFRDIVDSLIYHGFQIRNSSCPDNNLCLSHKLLRKDSELVAWVAASLMKCQQMMNKGMTIQELKRVTRLAIGVVSRRIQRMRLGKEEEHRVLAICQEIKQMKLMKKQPKQLKQQKISVREKQKATKGLVEFAHEVIFSMSDFIREISELKESFWDYNSEFSIVFRIIDSIHEDIPESL